MAEAEDKVLISPATTPGSCKNENTNIYLIPYGAEIKNEKPSYWYKKIAPPYALLTASLFQLTLHIFKNDEISEKLRFEPKNQLELWRFFTYIFLHENWIHLLLNIVIQCIYAAALENKQGQVRVITLYLSCGAIGALGAACFRPEFVIGASGGVYALLLSHLSNVILNYKTIKYLSYRCVSILIIIISDVGYNLVHAYNMKAPVISWGAHVFGAISGLFSGLFLYRSLEKNPGVSEKFFCWVGIISSAILLLTLLVINLEIKRCTPLEAEEFIYFC